MNAWVKRKHGPDEVVSISLDIEATDAVLSYNLYLAYGGEYLGRVLFDADGYWIYDGEELSVDEQEQLGRFIINHMEVTWNS
jgi:hypothetical protein